MDKISTILVPFDFSRTSKKALDYAVEFIGQNKDMKIILGYISEEHNVDMLKEAFSSTLAQYKMKGNMEWLVASGSLTETLMKIQKEESVDLIIMGTFGTIVDGEPGETNTSKLVIGIDCPVLVVPYGMENFQIKNIALVLGKEEIEDREALGTLLDIGRKFNAKVHVVTIENRPELYGYSNIDAQNENTLAYYLEDFYSDHTFIENPDVLEGILNYASEKAIDMITIFPRNHSKKSEPSEGQLTQLLTLHSKIPVLAID